MSKNDWIPVSERLPELELVKGRSNLYRYFDSERLLLQMEDGYIFVGICRKTYHKGDGIEKVKWFSIETGREKYDIVAWQPLPERYEVE